MKPKEIQKLIELVETSSVNEIEVTRWGRKVIIRKQGGNNIMKAAPQEQVYISPTQAAPIAAPAPIAAAEPVVAPTVSTPDNLIDIKSPMVGTFYGAPSPEASFYVKEGDKVSKGQVLCIIEAMKLMNEIEAEDSYRIVEILAENGQPVEYDQVLFRVEK